MTQNPQLGGDELEKYRSYLMVLAISQMLGQRKADYSENDLVQSVLAIAYQKRNQYRGNSPAQLKTWLRTILKHHYINHVNARKAQKRDPGHQVSIDDTSFILDRLADELGQSPSQIAHGEERRMKLYSAILDLELDSMSAVILVHLKGLSTEEAGRILGKTRHSIGGLVARGLSNLKKALKGLDDPN